MDGDYSVQRCYAKCDEHPECESFMVNRRDNDRECQLFKKGCIAEENDTGNHWEFYSMEHCWKGKLIFHVYYFEFNALFNV